MIAAGGFDANLALWDESPGSTTNCPVIPNSDPGTECGSNYTVPGSYARQESMGSAQAVLSTTYPNKNWVDFAHCGDGFPGPGWGNGVGLCTGTSMSAPQVSGVVGILRSINPLVGTSDPEPTGGTLPGVRTVLAQAGHPWNAVFGYGPPDAAVAAREMLGTVAGATVHNRAIPLFRLRSAWAKDYADTTSPQYALGLIIAQTHAYAPPATLPAVPAYAFPFEPVNESAPATPRAAIYVLATERRPRNEWPPLLPLYLMDTDRANGKDYLLATSAAEIEHAHAAPYHYKLRTIQGYIYQTCANEPACIPPDAQKLWREYNTADADCAIFLNSEKNAFEAAHYTDPCPAGSTTLLGYAYPATDTDGDGLPDGFEQVVGTSPTRADSDGDGATDRTEFPMVGVPVGDPCAGGTGSRYCSADVIFKYGFDV